MPDVELGAGGSGCGLSPGDYASLIHWGPKSKVYAIGNLVLGNRRQEFVFGKASRLVLRHPGQPVSDCLVSIQEYVSNYRDKSHEAWSAVTNPMEAVRCCNSHQLPLRVLVNDWSGSLMAKCPMCSTQVSHSSAQTGSLPDVVRVRTLRAVLSSFFSGAVNCKDVGRLCRHEFGMHMGWWDRDQCESAMAHCALAMRYGSGFAVAGDNLSDGLSFASMRGLVPQGFDMSQLKASEMFVKVMTATRGEAVAMCEFAGRILDLSAFNMTDLGSGSGGSVPKVSPTGAFLKRKKLGESPSNHSPTVGRLGRWQDAAGPGERDIDLE